MTHNSSHSSDHPDYSLYAADGQKFTPWLKNYDQGVPPEIENYDVPLHHWLDRSAEKSPNALAVSFKNFRLKYRELQRLAEIVAANLMAHGIKEGDRVSIMMPNLPQTVIAFWGVMKAGAVAVMTNPLYMENEILYQLTDSNAKCLITLDMLWPKVKNLRLKLGVKKYFITTLADGLKFPLNLLLRLKSSKKGADVRYDNDTVLPFKALLKGTERFSARVDNPSGTIAMLQYSGGTTGVPKGAMLSHSNFSANILQAGNMLYEILQKPQNFLAVMPFFHVYGLTTCLLLPAAYSCAVFPCPKFSPVEVMQMIQKDKLNVFPGAPSVYIAMFQQKDVKKYDLSSMICCISGSAPMPVEYIKVFQDTIGAGMIEGYGLTEASPITHLNPLRGKRKTGSIGLALPSTECRVVDMELGSLQVPPGTPGELVVKGPQVMLGYWNRPDETANVLRNGWLYTGDIATMDEDGYVFIVDRKKDMVIIGGYNVYPREIDEVLYSHPKIQDAVAVGVPHPSRGEIIKAYIVLKPFEKMTRSEVLSYCRARLANYKVPKQVEFRDALPKTMVGKILRRALRAEEEAKVKAAGSGDATGADAEA